MVHVNVNAICCCVSLRMRSGLLYNGHTLTKHSCCLSDHVGVVPGFVSIRVMKSTKPSNYVM